MQPYGTHMRDELAAAYAAVRELADLAAYQDGAGPDALRARLLNAADDLAQTILMVQAGIFGCRSQPAKTIRAIGEAGLSAWRKEAR